ncbi:MAG: phosphoribosylformylglycinamidine cyclo-ligase [Halobacteriovoraceae bacterium]|jgi:phosphoribosylformylglycinamidine cyclo-ligase|nr:phosphoribosylformylglycinamidine cyclo-ligase [Halobacteriovoraceae bacterium]
MDYKEAGVDVEKGDLFVDKIKSFIKDTYTENVVSGVGGFAALYDQGDHYLASGTDGVGTKIKIAVELGIHDTIGQDLVAMCVNDILCTGAMPMFFLDYLASSKLDLEIHQDVVKGIAHGCKLSQCALIGGETAEMPDMYQDGEYDLAGFVVGRVEKKDYIDGSKLEDGMSIYALSSSGFHSNGYSLVRKLIQDSPRELKEKCLTPTKIYVQEVKNIMQDLEVFGMAHITGGGLNNIKRINADFGYDITSLPDLPDFMQTVTTSSKLTQTDLYQTFNMGIGFVFILKDSDLISEKYPQLIKIGQVNKDISGVRVLGEEI